MFGGPAGAMMGGVLTLAGGIFVMFSKTESPEVKLLKKIQKQNEKLIKITEWIAKATEQILKGVESLLGGQQVISQQLQEINEKQKKMSLVINQMDDGLAALMVKKELRAYNNSEIQRFMCYIIS